MYWFMLEFLLLKARQKLYVFLAECLPHKGIQVICD